MGGLFFLYLPAGNSVCWCLRRFICTACGSPATYLIWHAVALEFSRFLASCLTLLAGNFSRSTLPSLMVLETNSSSLRKNQKMSLCRIFAVSGGYFARLNWACTALYHSFTLLLPCLKLVSRSNLACTSLYWGLQNSSNLLQIVSSITWSVGKPQDTYWSMSKSPDQAMTFLHCCLSGNAASLNSRMFSHFRCHCKNLWYKPLLTVQSILEPSKMYGINILGTSCGCLGWWNVISGSGSCWELDSSSWLPVCVSSGRDSAVALQTELLVVLGILGLCLEWSGLFQNYTTTGFFEQATHKLGISALCIVETWKSLY